MNNSEHNDHPRIAIVSSRFNNAIVQSLYAGAMRCLAQHSIDDKPTVVDVPGAFEIAVAVKALLVQNKYDAVITLGAVIRGETPHFEYISSACANSIAQLGIAYAIPVTFGILTVDNMHQAMDRAGDDESNKGFEAAAAALEMIEVLQQIKDES